MIASIQRGRDFESRHPEVFSPVEAMRGPFCCCYAARSLNAASRKRSRLRSPSAADFRMRSASVSSEGDDDDNPNCSRSYVAACAGGFSSRKRPVRGVRRGSALLDSADVQDGVFQVHVHQLGGPQAVPQGQEDHPRVHRSAAKLPTRDEARRIGVNFAKLHTTARCKRSCATL
jgi:hypothetical protein